MWSIGLDPDVLVDNQLPHYPTVRFEAVKFSSTKST